jgi:hypothetical protein
MHRGVHGEEHVGRVLLFHQLKQAVHGHRIVSVNRGNYKSRSNRS